MGWDVVDWLIDWFINQWLYSRLLGPGLFFSFVIFFTQTVGLLEWVSSPSQGHYLHTEHHKHRINAHRHPCLEWNSNPRSQRSSKRRQSCLRPRGQCGCRWLVEENLGKLLKVECVIIYSCLKLVPGVRHKYGLGMCETFYVIMQCNEFA
jgi:hypothetical protein